MPMAKARPEGAESAFRRLSGLSRSPLRWAAILLLLAAQVGAPAATRKDLYDPAKQKEALKSLKSGDLRGALEGFCGMLEISRGRPLWTFSVVLICDAAEVVGQVEKLRGVEPVFLQERIYQGQTCYRLCAGLAEDRKGILALRGSLPKEFEAAGPFATEVQVPCAPSTPGPSKKGDAGAASPPEGADTAGTASSPELVELRPVPAKKEPAEGPEKAPSPPTALGSGGAAEAAPPPADQEASAAEEARVREAESWFRKGVEAHRAGNPEEAERCYRQSLTFDPDKPETLNNLGLLILDRKSYGEARDLFQKAVWKSQGYSRAHLGLAGALWGLGRSAEAVEEARTAVNLDPHDVSALMTLASFLRGIGKEDEALAKARLVLIFEPDNAAAAAFIAASPKK